MLRIIQQYFSRTGRLFFCLTLLLSSLSIKQISSYAGLTKNEGLSSIGDNGIAGGDKKYIVIVDCGSSGSRAHIYWWSLGPTLNSAASNSTLMSEDELHDALITSITPLVDETTGKPVNKKIKPGLASVRDQPETASDYMKPLMDFVAANIPDEKQPETPVYFLGTAGLRLLEKSEQEAILNDIANDYKVLYNFEKIYTDVISGIQEGIYQWMSINSNGKRLGSEYDVGAAAGEKKGFFCQSPMARRYGVIEVGGASIQVTYEVGVELDEMIRNALRADHEALKAYKASLTSVPLGSTKTVTLFSATFLGLGSNSVREAAIDLLVRDTIRRDPATRLHNSISRLLYTLNGFIGTSPASAFINTTSYLSDMSIDDPCLPKGASERVQKPIELLFSSKKKTIGYGISKDEEQKHLLFNVKLVGTGNYPMCQQLLNRVTLLAKQERLNCREHFDIFSQNYCSTSLIRTPFIPFKYIQFLGLAELYYTTNEMLAASGKFNGFLIQKKTAQICSTPFELLSSLYPEANRVDKTRTLLECFKSTWILSWLYVGLGLSVKFDSNIETVERLNGKELDWTLGAAVAKLSDTQLLLK